MPPETEKNFPKLRIGIIAPFQEPVSMNIKYGGTERVVYELVKGLYADGYEVHLFASGDSGEDLKSISHFHEIFPKSLRSISPYSEDTTAREVMGFVGARRALDLAKELNLDLVHNHVGWSAILLDSDIPMLTTLHGDLAAPIDKIIYSDHPEAPVISISDSQRKPMPQLNYIDTVYNGIPVEAFDFVPSPGEYLIWIGRMTKEKAPDIAIDAAVHLGIPLILAGKVDGVDGFAYYKREIEPRIQKYQDLIKFIGEVDHQEKNWLLGGALAFLMPIQWEEPFGLVVPEAMACGTPVIATRRGSMPELIEDGKTGFLIPDTPHKVVLSIRMANAVKRISEINREDCRKAVLENFDSKIMVKRYEEVYDNFLKGRKM
jgi:glycosyltransferase involved in cell wall biosynthesis